MTGDFANVIRLQNDQPLLFAIAPKEYGRDFTSRTIGLGLPHPLFWFYLLATLTLNMKWKVLAYHIARSALWITGILLCASGLLPTLLP